MKIPRRAGRESGTTEEARAIAWTKNQLCGSCPPCIPNVWLALTALLLLDSHLGAALAVGVPLRQELGKTRGCERGRA